MGDCDIPGGRPAVSAMRAHAAMPAARRSDAGQRPSTGSVADDAKADTPADPAACPTRHTQITLGFAPAAVPLSFSADHGAVGGLAGDYLQRLRGAGASWQVERSHDWQDLRQKLRDGRIDAAMGIPADTASPGHGWVFSAPFLVVPNVVVTRTQGTGARDIDALSGRRVLMSDPERLRGRLLQRAPLARIVPARSAEQALQRLLTGEADAYIGNQVLVEELLRRRFAGQLQIAAAAGFNDELALAVRQPCAPLAAGFTRLLQEMRAEEHQALRDRWLTPAYSAPATSSWAGHWAVPLLIAMLAALLMHGMVRLRLWRERASGDLLELRLEQISRHLPAVVYQMQRQADGSLGFPYVAGDVASLFGLDSSQAMQSPLALLDCIDARDRLPLRRAIEESARGFTALAFEFRTVVPGRTRWLRTRAQPYASDAGTVTWSGYWVDVTQSRAQRDELEQARAAAEEAVDIKARFLAVMSHEIRTPMSGVLGMLEMLGSAPLQAPLRAPLQRAEEAAQSLRLMLDDILDHARLDAGALRIQPVPQALRPLLKAVQARFARQARAKGLRLQLQVDPCLAAVHDLDALRLRQVLCCLAARAVRRTARGRVCLRVEVLDGGRHGLQRLRLRVRDTGPQLQEGEREALLQPLLHSGPGRTPEHAVVGLGLNISQRLVQLMGGTLDINDIAEGGTEADVQLLLPVASADDAAAALPDAGHAASRLPAVLRNARVLVLEDHPLAQAMTRWRLQRLGVTHTVLGDGRQGLALLATEPVDLVITDCHMPVMDGYAFTRLLREREGRTGAARLPVVALTASVCEEDHRRCRDAGMDEVLVKPVSLRQLRACLQRCLATKRAPAMLE